MRKIYITILMLVMTLIFSSCGKEQKENVSDEISQDNKVVEESLPFTVNQDVFTFKVKDAVPTEPSYFVTCDDYYHISLGNIYYEETLETDTMFFNTGVKDVFLSAGTFYMPIQDTRDNYTVIIPITVVDDEAPKIMNESNDFEISVNVCYSTGELHFTSEEYMLEQWWKDEYEDGNFRVSESDFDSKVGFSSIIFATSTFGTVARDNDKIEKIYFKSNGLPYLYFMDFAPEGGDIEDTIVVSDPSGNTSEVSVKIHVMDNRIIGDTYEDSQIMEDAVYIYVVNKEVLESVLPSAAYDRIVKELSDWMYGYIFTTASFIGIEEESIIISDEEIVFMCAVDGYDAKIEVIYNVQDDEFSFKDVWEH